MTRIIAQGIIETSIKKGMTARQLALLSGLSLSTVYRLLNGSCLNPRVSTLVAISQALKIRLNELLADVN